MSIIFSLYECYFKPTCIIRSWDFFVLMMTIFTTTLQFSWPFSFFYWVNKHRLHMLHTDFYSWGNCEQNREILHFNIHYFRAMKSRTKQRSTWHVMSTQERHSGFSFHLKWPTKYWNSAENKNENYLICCISYVKSRMPKDVQMSHVFVSLKRAGETHVKTCH